VSCICIIFTSTNKSDLIWFDDVAQWKYQNFVHFRRRHLHYNTTMPAVVVAVDSVVVVVADTRVVVAVLWLTNTQQTNKQTNKQSQIKIMSYDSVSGLSFCVNFLKKVKILSCSIKELKLELELNLKARLLLLFLWDSLLLLSYFLPLYLVVVFYANFAYFSSKGSSKCGFPPCCPVRVLSFARCRASFIVLPEQIKMMMIHHHLYLFR